MAKNKSKSNRIKEVMRAQKNSVFRGQLQDKLTSAVIDNNNNFSQPKKLSQRLNTTEIKKDIIKTVIFAFLVIAFLLIIKTQGLQLNFGIYK